MGVLVPYGMVLVGSLLLVRSTVSTKLWKKAHLEPAGGILAGRVS